MPEIFRLRGPSRVPTTRAEKRTSPRLRGYDARWDAISIRFRRRHPFCRFCDQAGGRDVLCDVVDHVIPVVDRPDLQHDWSNLQSLCTMHHGGLKAWLEEQAREAGDIEVLTWWCSEPRSRPIRRGEVTDAGT